MKKNNKESNNYYSTSKVSVQEIALIAIFAAIVVIASIITGPLMPPILGSRPDFWPGVVVLSLFFLKTWKGKLIFCLTFSLIMMPFELSDYVGGIAEFALSFVPSLLSLMPLVFYSPKTFKMKLLFSILVLFLFLVMRFLMFTISGIVFYKVTFIASLIYNSKNFAMDLAVSLPVMLLSLFKLRRKNQSNSQS